MLLYLIILETHHFGFSICHISYNKVCFLHIHHFFVMNFYDMYDLNAVIFSEGSEMKKYEVIVESKDIFESNKALCLKKY